MKIDQLPTPVLLLEESLFNKNRQTMKNIIAGSKLQLRPHYKSHKCAAIAHMQMADGAKGMTCAKLDEALDLADSGIEDILIANQITDPSKIVRGAILADSCRLTVCMDNEENIDAWERAAAYVRTRVHCLIEYEIGMRRCGAASEDEVLRLAEKIASCPHLVFDGIQAYAGHISHMESESARRSMAAENNRKISSLLARLSQAGAAFTTVSGGSTGTAAIKAKDSPYTELQAGSYLFMDACYARLSLPFENSLTLLSTVVSAKNGLTVIDAGIKSCGIDQGMPEPLDFAVCEVSASEEHFQLSHTGEKRSIGERIRLVPAHCCSTVNLHDRIYVVDGEKVVDRLSVTARGCFR